jgi:hypothetical protein
MAFSSRAGSSSGSGGAGSECVIAIISFISCLAPSDHRTVNSLKKRLKRGRKSSPPKFRSQSIRRFSFGISFFIT